SSERAPRRPRASSSSAPTRTRSNAKGEATRELLLLTAEELFAERGIAAVALRDIGIAAGQRNNIAEQYHFGDREALVQQIIEYRAIASEEIRGRMIADLFVDTSQPDVRDLI